MRKYLSLCAALAIFPGTAEAAASGKSSAVAGASEATVVAPAAMTNTGDLRFGQFTRPSAAGTITISTAGAMSGTGGTNGNWLITQTAGGPAPGTFQIVANLNQGFTVYGPISATITNGGASMTITNMTGSLVQTASNAGKVYYTLSVGGTLNVAANQAIGTYTGTYSLTTVYQ